MLSIAERTTENEEVNRSIETSEASPGESLFTLCPQPLLIIWSFGMTNLLPNRPFKFDIVTSSFSAKNLMVVPFNYQPHPKCTNSYTRKTPLSS